MLPPSAIEAQREREGVGEVFGGDFGACSYFCSRRATSSRESTLVGALWPRAVLTTVDPSSVIGTCRHSGVQGIRVIQVLLGHSKLDTTALYARVATKTIRSVTSPLEHLALLMQGEEHSD
jgi:hypothetical protein